jgi:hypothetical protein
LHGSEDNWRALGDDQLAQRFPSLQWMFYRPSVAARLPDGARFDVLARVQHVGRMERTRSAATPGRYVLRRRPRCYPAREA